MFTIFKSIVIDGDKVDNHPKLRVVIQKTGYGNIRVFSNEDAEKAQGGAAFNGLKMLLFQGIIAYELWNDVSITEAEAMRVYAELKAGMGIK
ncbi:MAG: hypothetical protein MJ182_10610 [Treponema sp.]|nr:hypothetical protein [Treponema sp.]